MSDDMSDNAFTSQSLALVYVKTALPIIFVMAMNGLLAVADALFLGRYVGPLALAAVTMMFPMYMLIVALSTLVSSGMSSQLARYLGGGRLDDAQGVFAGAHGLSCAVGAVLICLFLGFGTSLALAAAGGSQELAQMGLVYLRITVFFSPLLFMLSVNSDALRNEGRVGLMAAMSLLVSLSNIGFNYVLIAVLDMGVAGSAYGTAAAQLLAFAIILVFRIKGRTVLRPSALLTHSVFGRWSRILQLGAPQSLNFIGLALGSAAIMSALLLVGAPNYGDTVSAYGIMTRIMTFAYLPMLGLSFAMQTITGNNYGAQLWHRSDASLRIALWAALIYGAAVQAITMSLPRVIAAAFVSDPHVIDEVGRILPIMTAVFLLSGPMMILAGYFQTIGAAGRAALFGLSKPYLFALPLTFMLPLLLGETGIWMASPLAEVLMLVLALVVLRHAARQNGLRWGIFHEA